MAVIEKRIKLRGSKGESDENALFDSGATYSCIQQELAQKIANLEPLPEPMEFGTAGKDFKLKATKRVSINFYMNGDRFSDEFMVVDGLSDRVIIGAKTLQSWRMKLDFEHDEVLYDPKVTKLRII
ncbi:retropepsin-like domain-containing protein [candidate division WOR-3 bacterium]|nr:retropepsin-like domain-containing protein [candidate division WOR-3 bacterium]